MAMGQIQAMTVTPAPALMQRVPANQASNLPEPRVAAVVAGGLLANQALAMRHVVAQHMAVIGLAAAAATLAAAAATARAGCSVLAAEIAVMMSVAALGTNLGSVKLAAA